MADTIAFDPSWYYHRDGRTHLARTAAEEAALLAEDGWADTPAAHGKITAPSPEQWAQMPRPMVPDPGQGQMGQMAFSHLLLQWQEKLNAADARYQTVQDQLTQQAQGHESVELRLHSLATRLTALEAAGTAPAALPPTEAPRSTGRRSTEGGA